MYQPYLDILRKLGPPLWWDEEGVPRYDKFAPDLCANIYADYAALIAIRCQGCRRTFPVSSTWSLGRVCLSPHGSEHIVWDKNGQNGQPKEGLPKAGDAGCFGYGDAPWHDYDGGFEGQCSGTTMTTDVVRVLECWGKKSCEWERLKEHEVYIGEDDETLAGTKPEVSG